MNINSNRNNPLVNKTFHIKSKLKLQFMIILTKYLYFSYNRNQGIAAHVYTA